MKKTSSILLIFIMLFAVSNAFADYSGLYVFGDSLSSEKLWNASGPHQAGSGSNWPGYFRLENPTAVYANYAQGGLETYEILATVASHIAAGSVDSTGLYTIWGGANDHSPYAGNIIDAVSRLHAAGAGTILVSNMHSSPYLGNVIPEAFNVNLHAGINLINSDNIVQADVYSLSLEMQANPTSFGYTSAEAVFSDSLHFTTEGTKILADYYDSILKAGPDIILLPEGVLMETRAHLDTVLREVQAINPETKGDKDFFAYLDMTSAEFDAGDTHEGVDGDGIDILIGGSVTANEKLSLGAVFGMVTGDYDFGSGNGSYTVNMNSLSLFLKTSFNDKLEGAFVIALASPDIDDISREVILGPKTISMDGSTSADLTALTGALTYEFKQTEKYSLGVELLLRHIDISVDEFSEDGNLSTSMKYSDTERTSTVAGLSLYFDRISETEYGLLNTFGEIGYESDSGDAPDALYASVAKLNANPFKASSGYDAESSAFQGSVGFKLTALNGIAWKGTASFRQGEDSSQFGITLGASKAI